MKTLNYPLVVLFFISCSQSVSVSSTSEVSETTVESESQEETIIQPKFTRDTTVDYTNLSDSEWKKILNEKEYYVLREKGTERAFTGDYVDFKEKGTFVCKGCATKLFSSKTKFKSGTGWPSFYDIIDNNVLDVKDNSYGMVRTEVVCVTCKGHLGHVFNDGPNPTGLRYCINSVSLAFEAEK